MSVQAISWALSVRVGSPSAKCVLLALANYANERGLCWPSQERLAVETDQSVDSVQRRLADLEKSSIIRRLQRGRKYGKRATTLYALCMLDCEAFDDTPSPDANETTPQIAASSPTTPQNKPFDAALLRDKPKEPSITAAALGQPGKISAPLISAEALKLAHELSRIQGIGENDPRIIGAPYQVQQWLTKGWHPDLIRQAVEIVMARGKGAPQSLRYFEKIIGALHAERQRSLGAATIDGGDANGKHPKGRESSSTKNGKPQSFAGYALQLAKSAAET
jgi:hypothetical protein